MVTRSPKDLRGLALAGSAILAIACGHTDPFDAPPYGTTQPFDATPPARLTLNTGPDRSPAWLPDGSGILYSAQQLTRADGDVCLAELPPTGGTQRRLVCDLHPPEFQGGRNVVESPAGAPDGRVAFVRAYSAPEGTSPAIASLVVGSLLDPSKAAVVQALLAPPGGGPQPTITHLHWLDPGHLAYVKSGAAYRQVCAACPFDTLVTGQSVALLDVGPGGGAAPVPGTDFASGASPGASADELYYTLGGDTRVYRRTLSTGDVTVAYDFGAAGIARDVAVAGGRLAAIVGGRVTFGMDPTLGPTQWDSGGVVHVVDLASNSDVALEGPGLFRQPAISPAGDRLVAEGYPLIIVTFEDPPTGQTLADTTVSHNGDLYLFGAP